MAKLRKMLGNIEDPSVIGLMRLIETQSKERLVHWAVGCAREQYLPIYEKAYPEDRRYREILDAACECADGIRKLKDVKPLLREANQIAREAEADPAAQAAARAMATASSVIQTPTGALGFTFYGVAAVTYDRVGLEEKPTVYDALASEELKKLLESLQKAAVPGEEHPVKVNWNC